MAHLYLLLSITTFTAVITETCCEVHPKYGSLLKNEHHLWKTMEFRVQHDVFNVHQLERKLVQLLSKINSNVTKEEYIGNPLAAVTLARRLADDWTSLVAMTKVLHHRLQMELGKKKIPTDFDVTGMARGLARTQMTYNLSTDKLVHGQIFDNRVEITLSAADCFVISKAYYRMHLFAEAKTWLEKTLEMIHGGDSSISPLPVLYDLFVSLCASGETARAQTTLSNLLNKYSKILHQYQPEHEILHFAGQSCSDISEFTRQWKTYIYNSGGEDHERLCQGYGQLQSGLRCRYIHYQRPHLMIQPFKLEELYRDPPVVMFHNLTTDQEAEQLKIVSLKYMGVAKVKGRDGQSDGVTSVYRTSHVAWIADGISEVVDRLNRRIADATQLDKTAVQQSQLSRYGVAGEFLPHTDDLQGTTPWIIDRLATLMFYLNDVEMGGHTVFLHLNLTIKPVKNSAVLWFSVTPSGEHDELSTHSGCPVIKGSKWVLNKWFLNGGNAFTVPCGLNRNDSFNKYYMI